MMALAPVLEMRAEIFKEQFPTQYTTARDWYSHMKGDRLIDPKLASPGKLARMPNSILNPLNNCE